MDIVNPNSKKARRLESKKRKAAAFLALLDDRKETHTASNSSVIILHLSQPDGEMLSEDVLMEMKRIVRERKKQAMTKPKVFLTLEAMIPFRVEPGQEVNEDDIPPLYVMDLQQLLLYGLQGNMASYKPRWCKLLRVGKISSVVLLMLEGVSYNDYLANKGNFPFISQTFTSYTEMVCPRQYMQTLDGELYSVPLSVSQLKKVNIRVPKAIRDSVVAKIAQPVGKAGSERFSRTCLLLSTYQMMLEGYPLPVQTNIGRYRDFVFTKEKYAKVTADSPLYALDCEMCTTTARKNELTRVSVVSETGKVLYDTLVKPANRIINYLTRYSGITKQMLDPVTTTIEDVQRDIRSLLPPDAILCGQSLNGDLIALKMFHPYVIDTSVIFNMSGNRYVKAGLRKLTQFFLGRTIQNSKSGHNSAEDATATLDLVKLKLTKGLEFGDATLSGVYFPDIHTYFMAGENNTSGVVQNVERDASEDTKHKVKTSESPPESDSALDSSNTGKGSESLPSSVSGESRQTAASAHSTTEPNSTSLTQDQNNSLSTSSSSSDSEGDDCNGEVNDPGDETETPLRKKRKMTEPGNSTSDSPDADNSEKDQPGTEASQSNTVTKCKDFLFTSTADLVEQQKQCLFSQDNSVHVSHSFFRLVYDAGRSACMIDRQEVIDKYVKEPVEQIVVTSDTEARKTAKAMVQSKEFVWAHFYEYSDEMEHATQERKQKLMRKLDSRVRSIMKRMKPNTLVAVVMTGRDSDEVPQNMAAFVTIT
ncbi:unnamed protein product [Candidula unifasciata]|uniref:Exonuclease domain-containing protein n=1 Tax=Candidula unifasciata TaxID=100452 RepID=A0A8S3Z448_9EUPU|nr:unnamed protein product [Candidula unifasciata]